MPCLAFAHARPRRNRPGVRGPWRARAPRDAAELLDRYRGRWWIAGGWAIQAFTGFDRPHADLDLSIPRADVDILREHLTDRLDLWAADSGTLRPLIGEAEHITATCDNLWLRASGADPWEYDVILMETTPTAWTYKRDGRITRPPEEILWASDGIWYLRPEVQLLHKAPGLRAKDQADFQACLPVLDPAARGWLRTALELAHPGHPWLNEL